MRRTPWTTYLWPGLAQLWLDGAWSGLLLAIGFAVVINMLLLASLVWGELVGGTLLRFGWLAAGVIWLCAACLSAWGRRQSVAETQATASEDLFRTATSEYLQGNWVAAESVLERMIEADDRDFEARLLLAALLRRTKRYKEARRQLGCLERLDRAAAWTPEIQHEKRWLDQLELEQHESDESEVLAQSETTTESESVAGDLTENLALTELAPAAADSPDSSASSPSDSAAVSVTRAA